MEGGGGRICKCKLFSKFELVVLMSFLFSSLRQSQETGKKSPEGKKKEDLPGGGRTKRLYNHARRVSKQE